VLEINANYFFCLNIWWCFLVFKILKYYSNRKDNTAYVIGAGAAGEIGYSYIDFWAADDCYTFDCPPDLNNRYLYFVLMSQQSKILSQVRKSSIPRLPRTAIEQLVIPVPPIKEQESIPFR